MGAPTCLLCAFAVLLFAVGQDHPWEGAYEADGEGVSVNAEHATQVEEAPAEEKPVEEGSWTEWIENKVTAAEEGVSEVVEEVEEGAENVKEEVEEVVEHPIAAVEEAVGIGGQPGGDDAIHGEELSKPLEEKDESMMMYSEVHPFIMHNGFIPELKGRDDSKMDLHWDHMTVHEAKTWCVEHPECAGFHHLGPAEEGPFEMTFKDYWEIDSEHEEENGHPTPHTAYRKSATPFYNDHEEHAAVDEEHDPLHMLQKEREAEAARNSETVAHLATVEPEEPEVHANNWKTMDHEWHEAGDEDTRDVAAPTAKQFHRKPRSIFLDKLPTLLESRKTRFNVGDKVMIMIDCMPGNCDHLRQGTKGMVGEVIEHDGSDQPYKIRFHNGNEAWYKVNWVTEVSDATLKLMGNHAQISELNSWHDEH